MHLESVHIENLLDCVYGTLAWQRLSQPFVLSTEMYNPL